MAADAAVNASPLIYLARAGLVDLLCLAGDGVVVPTVVFDELAARGSDDPAVAAVAANPWIEVVPAPQTPP